MYFYHSETIMQKTQSYHWTENIHLVQTVCLWILNLMNMYKESILYKPNFKYRKKTYLEQEGIKDDMRMETVTTSTPATNLQKSLIK